VFVLLVMVPTVTLEISVSPLLVGPTNAYVPQTQASDIMPTLAEFELLLEPLPEQVVVMRYWVATVWLTEAVAEVAPVMLFQVAPALVEPCH
jgi:hypothetical protein